MENGLWKTVREELRRRGYILIDKLSEKGESSNADVRLAEYQREGETVIEKRVLKMFSPRVSLTDVMNQAEIAPEKRDELANRELTILPQLKHPNIPRYCDYFSIPLMNGSIQLETIATQFIPMSNVQKTIDQEKKFDEGQTRKLLSGTLSALAYIHEQLKQSILHRDVKPSNILFDGETPYLIDFDFSQIGDNQTLTTTIDNHGYYPEDAFSGHRTPSQDLCALGNVAIAALLGKTISLVRNDQGINLLKQPRINELPISPHLQRFLTKLTMNSPAFRYQKASQALEDLLQLDTIDLETLEKKVGQITRDSVLALAIDELKKADPLFEYNVPPKVLSEFDDTRLLEHLGEAYKREEIIIEDPAAITRYARKGDRVIKSKDFQLPNWTLKEGSLGRFVASNADKVKVNFENVGELEVDIVDLRYAGEKGIIRDCAVNKDSGMLLSEKLAGARPLKKSIVELRKQLSSTEGTFIPDGTRGIIAVPFENQGYAIVWEQDLTGAKVPLGYTARIFSKEDFKLVRRNNIKFDQLYQDCAQKVRDSNDIQKDNILLHK